HGSVERGYLGVGISPVTRELADKLHAKSGEGVAVNEVMPKSPAAQAGVQEGDVIVAFNGNSVKGPRELQEAVERTKIGEHRSLTVLRDGKEKKLDLVVKALPKTDSVAENHEGQSEDQAAGEDAFRDKKLGMEVAN